MKKFYKQAWESKEHICEECGRYLVNFSPGYISHILSRGAHIDKAKDLRNVNILCFECHQKWEFGDRKKMKIYDKNQITIQILKDEYNAKRS
jgi:hypothetical protein